MSIDLRDVRPGDERALARFFPNVPVDDRTFFKEDITDPAAVAERWISDKMSVRWLACEGAAVVAFAALTPGVERMSHVGELRVVVAAHARNRGVGRLVARLTLAHAVKRGFRKVTIDIAAENAIAIRMFQELGFHAEALLRDQLLDSGGLFHDVVVLAHAADEQ
jgi:RimJ/RimL family protein N-acetyltransferase